jgi:signal transduction histidine kinase
VESLRSAIEAAGEETDRLIRLAEDLLLLARADSGQPFVKLVDVPLAGLLAAAAQAAGSPAAARAVTVQVRCPDELTVAADADRLRQAVDNLLDNAVRYTADGGVVEVAAAATPQGSVLIEVLDRGPGFPPAFLPHAFERFQRAEAARARDSGGTGLGLAIVRAIALAHAGAVTAANRPGGGAAVSIELER